MCSIVDPKVVEAHGGIQPGKRNDYLSANTAGTGAWIIDRWDQSQRIVLVRNPNYWRGWNGAHLNRVVLETVPEEETRHSRKSFGHRRRRRSSARRRGEHAPARGRAVHR